MWTYLVRKLAALLLTKEDLCILLLRKEYSRLSVKERKEGLVILADAKRPGREIQLYEVGGYWILACPEEGWECDVAPMTDLSSYLEKLPG